MRSPNELIPSRQELTGELDSGTDAHMRQLLRHCSPCTYYAAYQLRLTGDIERVPTFVVGLLRSQVATDLQSKLEPYDGALRLWEDLGVDSLTLIEIGILAEDALQISVSDDERRGLRTVDDFVALVARKAVVPDSDLWVISYTVGQKGSDPEICNTPSADGGIPDFSD